MKNPRPMDKRNRWHVHKTLRPRTATNAQPGRHEPACAPAHLPSPPEEIRRTHTRRWRKARQDRPSQAGEIRPSFHLHFHRRAKRVGHPNLLDRKGQWDRWGPSARYSCSQTPRTDRGPGCHSRRAAHGRPKACRLRCPSPWSTRGGPHRRTLHRRPTRAPRAARSCARRGRHRRSAACPQSHPPH